MQRIIPNLWFDGQAAEATDFYLSIFPNSRRVRELRSVEGGPGAPGALVVVEVELDGQRLVAIEGGPQFSFSEAVSLQVDCETQEEVDYYWERLSAGGEEGPCGWLKDKFGVSWQVAPAGVDDLFADADPERAGRAWQAMFGMKKLDIAAIRAAADGVPAA